MIHSFPQDLYRQFIILYLAEVMVGMGEETVLVEVAAVHELEGSERDESIASAVSILNFEWPRSETIRRRGLESSSKDLPCSLIIFVGGKRKVLGHAKVSKVPALPGELFVESVVVHHGLRGLGLGKLLMLKVRNADNHFYHSRVYCQQVEEYCKERLRATVLHLTTHDKQVLLNNTQAREAEMICSYCFRCFIPVVATPSVNLCAPLVGAAS